ncbi:MAG TPA: FUSC family protein [Pseudoduganella sp.]
MNSAVRPSEQQQAAAPAGVLAFLRDALQPYPGRIDASLRMVLACLVIVTISMTLQIPSTALAAYMVFFISREDMATTAKTGIALIVAATVAIILTLLVFRISVNQPALRLALMAALFGLGMYFSRISVLGALGFGLGFIFLITQSTVDLYPAGEPLVRDTLWTWGALTFSITVVILVNLMVVPARPVELLREEIRFRLGFVASHLELSRQSTSVALALPHGAMRALDPQRPFALMKLAASRDPGFVRRMPEYSAALENLGSLVEASCMLSALPAGPVSGEQAARLERLREACASLQQAIASPGFQVAMPDIPSAATAPPGASQLDILLSEMETDMARIWSHWQTAQGAEGRSAAQTAQAGTAPPAPAPAARPRLIVPDARSNPVYIQFALKVTFAAMLCYILYTGVNWPAIHTCVVTCAVIALTTSGATAHKATLRIAGALAGGAIALLATVFIVPRLESLGGLLLLIAPVTFAAAWISTGGERIAYFGWQMAFAFFLCILHGFQPSADVTVVRDRLIGVLLGTVVMGVVFRYVWPERATDQLRLTLARVLRNCMPPADRSGAAAARHAVLQDLRSASQQAAAAAFEGPLSGAARTEALFAATQAVALQCLHTSEPAPELADILHRYSDYLRGQHPGEPPPSTPGPAHTADEQALQLRLQWLRASCMEAFGRH